MSTDPVELRGMRRTQGAIDVSEVLRRIWRRRVVFAAVVGGCLLACIVYLHFVHFEYTIALQVTSVEGQSNQVRGTLGQLASAAGIALPNTEGDREDSFELFLQNIYSRETADELASDQALMQTMYPREWDAQTKTWHSPDGMFHSLAMLLRYVFGVPSEAWMAPNGIRVQQYIVRHVRISRDLKNPIVTVDMDHQDPEFAVQFLTKLRQVDDGRLRKRTLARTSNYIEYLNGELAKVTNDNNRRALIDLLSDQEKRRMFASSANIAYAAEPFGAVTSSALPTRPNSLLLLTLAIVVGILLSGFAAFLWDTLEPSFRSQLEEAKSRRLL